MRYQLVSSIVLAMIRSFEVLRSYHIPHFSFLSELFEGEEGIERPPTPFDVIRILAISARKSVVLEDADGTSALEYAILSDSDIITVKFLMHLTKIHEMPSGSYESNTPDIPKIIQMVPSHHRISQRSCTDRTVSTI